MIWSPRFAMASVIFGAAVIASGCSRREEVPPITVPPGDLKALVEGNNQFAIELYKKVAEEKGNILISPYSISSALAMTYAGAQGETAAQMAKTLHFTLPPDRLHPAFGGTTQWLGGGEKPSQYELSIANALWAQQGLKVIPEFLDVTGKSYGAGLRQVDFGSNPDAARQTINRWVEEQTRDKIKDLLQPGDIDRDTRFVLSNAIFFRGTWKHRFPESWTHDGDFEIAPGDRVKVPMMSQSHVSFRQSITEIWHVLELPYAGDWLAMVVMVPLKRCGLREAESRLSVAELEQALAGLHKGEASVSLPKFHFKSRFALKPSLAALGMPLAFSDAADFSGISPDARLRLKDVFHGGSIEVDEAGTVVAAATAVSGAKSAAPRPFLADHPFLFLIRDVQAGNILFIGRITDPR